MEPLRLSRDFELDVPVQSVWPALAYTDRLNRSLGLPPVKYTAPAPGGVVRGANIRLFGPLSVSWDEHPFDWVENERYEILRVYKGGPLKRFLGRVQFAPRAAGCLMTLSTEVLPRWRIGKPLGRRFAEGFVSMFAETARRVAAAKKAGGPDPTIVLKPRAGVDRERLREGARRLSLDGLAEPIRLLVEHIETADDVEAGLMRPFALADHWKLDRLETLTAFLRATKAGLLDLRWELLCPNCRVAKGSVASLRSFHAEGRCDFCNVSFTGSLDENVELRFSPNPSVREVRPGEFCIGGPGKTPHRRAQLRVDGGGRREAGVELTAERHVMRGLVTKQRVTLVPDQAGPAALTLPLGEGGPSELRFKPGRVSLSLENAGGPETWTVVETEAWGDKAVTAAFVTSYQEFRDLFSSEVLAPGAEVSIRSLALVFTDLKGSTAMYERVGDARAYAVVRDHFEVLFEVVKRRRGAVVKTIGDAVMAAFSSPSDAVAAALDMHAGLLARNEDMAEPVILKVGVHAGPAIAINSEGVLDYFGTTVNLAARVQNESRGGDLVLSSGAFEDPRCREVLKSDGGESEEFEVLVRGLSKPVRLLRFWPKACLEAGLREES
ncbi:MAG: adenylate/guanylate cyclase domain-containing protein [Elusimicrobia bacterium]|nr:adenylate/guanylate cyclase domain-containing protein [Elusimicrobiota bacterium]